MPASKDTVLKLVALGEIKAWDRNPRLNEEAVEPVAKSIIAHGYRDLMEVNGKMEFLAGHTRLKALLKIQENGGFEGIKGAITKAGKVMVLVHKGIKNEDAYRLANNKTGEYAGWDLPVLKDILEELDTGEIDMDETGFSVEEIEGLMTAVRPVQKPEMEISPELFERHDYIVFYFDNQFDWQVASEAFNLKQVQSAPIKQKTIITKGIGRVLPAGILLEYIQAKDE